jgi:acetyl esterase/lipase
MTHDGLFSCKTSVTTTSDTATWYKVASVQQHTASAILHHAATGGTTVQEVTSEEIADVSTDRNTQGLANRIHMLWFISVYRTQHVPILQHASLSPPPPPHPPTHTVQEVTSEVIAGVPTFTATPKGFASNTSSSRLLVYLHGGAYVKGACDKLWQVGRMGGWCGACSKLFERPLMHT